MIISHKHRFIFVHCRKAAGSSVVSSLSRYLGNKDLQFSAITDCIPLHIYPPRRVIKEALGVMTAADILAIMTLRKSFWAAISSSIKRKYSARLGESPTHAPAYAVAAAFPDEWRDYFKFCIVRNPWDKTLSDYFWRTKRLNNPPTFDDYVNALENGNTLNGIIPKNHQNWLMYTINDRVAVDCVVRFEDMVNGLTQALAHTTVKWDGWLPHMKKGTGANDTPQHKYREHYSDDAAQTVGRLYEKEIKEFDYHF